MIKRVICLAVGCLMTVAAWAGGNCSVTVESNDLMRFNTKEIVIDKKQCSEFSITLTNIGKMPKTIMGHNLLIVNNKDFRAVAADGIRATIKNDHIKPGDERVLAHTKLLGPGESDTIKFATNIFKDGEKYIFFCSFPQHASSMKGNIVLQ